MNFPIFTQLNIGGASATQKYYIKLKKIQNFTFLQYQMHAIPPWTTSDHPLKNTPLDLF